MGGPYTDGDSIRTTATFINIFGVTVDPTVVTLLFRYSLDTVTTTVNFPTAPIVKDAVGQYHADFDTTGKGGQDFQYEYLAPSGDPVQAINSGRYHINQRAL